MNESDEIKVRCPACGEIRCWKYGTAPNGRQRYRCHVCRRQFVADSDHRIDRDAHDIVASLLAQGVAPRKIARALPGRISLRWIYELRKRMICD